MRMRVQSSLLIAGFGAAAGLIACAEGASGPTGPQVGFTVAPLTLPGVTNACYNITVSTPESTVWSKTDVCSTQYGNSAGDITYIGPCDADFATNTVTLELVGLYAGGSPTPMNDPGEYVNPCPVGTTNCSRPFECNPNSDTFVEFNLAIMRSANQGFFDIAVNFEDIFCSAKVDCKDEFLFNADGERGPTAILALACTAGENSDTHLYMSDVEIHCESDNASVAIFNPSAGPGNHPQPAGSVGNDGFAVYNGTEDLGDYNKAYWNVAISIDEAELFADGSRKCWLRAWATASDGPLEDIATPANTTSPYVDFDVLLNPTFGTHPDGFEILTGTPNASLSCREHPLNAPTLNTGLDPGVRTVYDSVEHRICFQHELAADFTTGATTTTAFFNPPALFTSPANSYRDPRCLLDWTNAFGDLGPYTPNQTGSFQAGMFHDANGNGQHDADEPFVAHARFQLQTYTFGFGVPPFVGGYPTTSAYATADAPVTFSDLPTGFYYIYSTGFDGFAPGVPGPFAFCQGLGFSNATYPTPTYYFSVGGVDAPTPFYLPFTCTN